MPSSVGGLRESWATATPSESARTNRSRPSTAYAEQIWATRAKEERRPRAPLQPFIRVSVRGIVAIVAGTRLVPRAAGGYLIEAFFALNYRIAASPDVCRKVGLSIVLK